MAVTLVTTLPPTMAGAEALRFAREAWLAGAEALEVRSDLHEPDSIDATRLSAIIPLMVSERGRPLAASWIRAAKFADREMGTEERASRPAPAGKDILSHHAAEPLDPAQALELWKRAEVPPGASIKHVEPLGPVGSAARLLDTQRRLIDAFGAQRVTVLATSELALPFRCLLAPRNAFDYLTMEGAGWSAAPGQRLLADAVRDRRATGAAGARRAILGSGIAHSLSPRIHHGPFDRIDLPPDADVASLLAALLPHYDGLAVTSPFKKKAAQAIGSDADAVNTLVRRQDGAALRWAGFNTDLAGAQAALVRFDDGELSILGDGGATSAIRAACRENGRALTILRRDAWQESPLTGRALWTWPPHVTPPAKLSFRDCRVGVIAYGEPARRIGRTIRARGGTPLALGATWFAAQARGQRQLWEATPA